MRCRIIVKYCNVENLRVESKTYRCAKKRIEKGVISCVLIIDYYVYVCHLCQDMLSFYVAVIVHTRSGFTCYSSRWSVNMMTPVAGHLQLLLCQVMHVWSLCQVMHECSLCQVIHEWSLCQVIHVWSLCQE